MEDESTFGNNINDKEKRKCISDKDGKLGWTCLGKDATNPLCMMCDVYKEEVSKAKNKKIKRIRKYIEQPDGTFKCEGCGSTIKAIRFSNASARLSFVGESLEPIGSGLPETWRGSKEIGEKSLFIEIPYCPKCDERPGKEPGMKCF